MADLTTVARVKTWLNITTTDATRDALLGTILNGVTAAVDRYVGRTLLSATYTDEYVSGDGFTDGLRLKQYPVTTFTTLKQDGATVDASAYTVDLDAGIVYRVGGSSNNWLTDGFGAWNLGRRNFQATYTAGYTTAPEDLQNAAIKQVALEYKRSGYKGDRIGLSSEVLAGGSTAVYRVDAWAEGVVAVLDTYRRPF